jgi:PAS domain S-box-containing protein
VWHRPYLRLPEFIAMTRQAVFPVGVGLPGVAWRVGEPTRVNSATADGVFPRAEVGRREGIRQGFAFPIRSGGDIVGVIETYRTTPDEPDEELLPLMASLGDQIGQLVERQRVTQALHDSEAFYQSLVESLPLNLFRKDRDGRVTFGNQRYCATLKLPLEQLIGQTDFDLFPAEMAAKYRADDDLVLGSGQALELVEEHLLPSGSKIYVQVIKTPVQDGKGEVIGTQGMFWDVTPRKRAEEVLQASERRYRQLTEATLDAIVLADQQGRVTLFNPAAEKLFGYAAAEVVGQSLTLLIPPKYRAQHEAGFARFLATRVAHIVGRAIEIHGLHKDGTEFPIEIALSVIDAADGKGTELQFLGAIRDLTERNRIRSMLVQNEKLASIGLLSAGVAHEINNPLAFVGNNLAVLDRDGKGLLRLLDLYDRLPAQDPELAAQISALAEEIDLPYVRDNLPRLLARTREGVDRVTRIVHSLRGLARTDTPRRQDANLPDLVETSLEIIRGRLRRRGVTVDLDYDPDSRLSCVTTQIGQVLLNLLVNALQAIEATGRNEGNRITLRTRRQGGEMLIEIADNGVGIDAAHLPRLFDPFFTTKDVGEGTGLGLSITHNIITGHGGRIEVDSAPGRGATFRIHLPVQPGRGDRA